VPLTLDYDAFNLFLNALSPDYLPVGGTDITGALETALASFDPKSASDKAVILITDGENTGDGDPSRPPKC
jgi:Ca-activated chloride channel family protein